jgi:hypothetical protein
VAENQRQNGAGRRGGPDVGEVDPEAAERDAEAWELRERRFLRRPVELVRPVGDELAEVDEVGPERPPGVLGRVRPARRSQPRPKVIERRGAGLRGERLRAARASGMRRSLAAAPRSSANALGRRQSEPRASSKRDACSAARSSDEHRSSNPGLVGADHWSPWRAPKECGERCDHPKDFLPTHIRGFAS